jgi:type III pantothenate kinase
MVVGDASVEIGVRILVDEPDEVGADRLVNAASAHARFGGPLIVVDFGTATTFDVVDRDGNYCGGVIAPGVNLSLDALHMAAAKLPRVAVQRPEKVIGKRTNSAMMSGVYWGYVGLIEGLLSRIQAEFGDTMIVVATGGLAPLFVDATDTIEHLDSDLTLRGLTEIYRRNLQRRN